MLYNLGDIDSAIEYFEKAIDLTQYKMATNGLAAAYYSKWAVSFDDNPELAKIYLTKAKSIGLTPQQIFNLCATKGEGVLDKTLDMLTRVYNVSDVIYIIDPVTGKSKLL